MNCYPVFTLNAATLKFGRNEVLDDIKAFAYIEGDTMKSDDAHAKHQVYDVCEPGNVELVTRILDTTFTKCVELCYPYAKSEISKYTARDNGLKVVDEYVMKLNLPATFSESTVTLLESLIHDLMVARVMERWMGLTKPESEARWKEEAEKTEPEIKRALNSRTKCFTRRLHPFG